MENRRGRIEEKQRRRQQRAEGKKGGYFGDRNMTIAEVSLTHFSRNIEAYSLRKSFRFSVVVDCGKE